MSLREVALRALTAPGVSVLWHPLTRGAAVVFMLHRFDDPDHGVRGFSPDALRRLLAFLRRRRYALVGVHQVLRSLRGDAPPLRCAVAFTIDDGYREQATVAGPVFGAYDCPVTTFVTTGFLDGSLWFWWDQIEYVFARTRLPGIQARADGALLTYDCTSPAGRQRAQADFTSRCKAVPDRDKHAAIRGLAAAADVELPNAAPHEHAPMTWDELRAAESGGMSFGPHTVTHPILSRTDDAQSREEIRGSWERLRAEARAPVPIFAYPNGQRGDFSAREIGTLQELGLEGACIGEPGYATRTRYQAPGGAYRIPRYSFPDSEAYVAQFASGLERVKRLLRRMD
jgi:peptidoglycan/xylan/chitin deacetylase (PgdA/CDA1 family)